MQMEREPYILSKEPYISRKEPYILSMPCVAASSARNRYQKKILTLYQKSQVSYEKGPILYQCFALGLFSTYFCIPLGQVAQGYSAEVHVT